ncbi:SpoIIE family protein phosphatase [Streptomyces sp. NRRL S-87]|uniref:SpoIIE family protein phosphatase n=1 Tax=Streptomyces sp. NRRL S-87 TaxID=1463920 RepID=UPI00099CA629|nr:SpoIIE family protein phosphatase [Streptomyces sp. NRRL S-87]
MRARVALAHAGCVNGRAPDGLALVLAHSVVGAIESVGGYAGGVFLRTETAGLLRLAVLAGLPAPLFRPWWRMHVNRPFPVAEAYRTGQGVHLADAEEAMRRFPQLMAGLPYTFGSSYEPLVGGPGATGEKYGVLMVLRRDTPGAQVAEADQARMRRVAHRLAEHLDRLARRGTAVTWADEPVAVQLPAPLAPPAPVGGFTWDPESGVVTADAQLCAALGTDPDRFPGTVEALTAGWAPAEVLALHVLARQLTGGPEGPDGPPPGPGVPLRLRLSGPAGRIRLLELSPTEDVAPGAPTATPGGPTAPRTPAATPLPLSGRLIDLGDEPLGGEITDQLPHSFLGLDRLGRITYVNEAAVALLGRSRPTLVGRVLWEALPWFGQAAYEDFFRAALIAEDPVQFLARSTPDEWVAVSLHPVPGGVTVMLAATERSAYAPSSVVRPVSGLGSPADRATALYRPVALAIALTEAVTARQVSAVVTEELLPAFGGRQLAIYLLNERHLYLAWETGFPQGFLDRFDGVSLDARLPGVETLTTGRPLFFESMEHLAAAYPGIPLDAHIGARAFLPLIASGRPVGSCILGFDAPRGFSLEERTVLTALAGLIAQALERAQRYDTEAALARGLQDALLPHRLLVRENVDTVGRYLPGTQGMEVGGDWYDVIETGTGLLALVIGDVQGHGVNAAGTMGQLRSAVRAFSLSSEDPQTVMSGTNRLLIDLDPGQFASCCYVVLDPATGQAHAVRAGHPPPLLRRPDGRTEVLDLAGGVVLGVDDGASYPVTELHLDPGAVLALFTDGLVEHAGEDIDEGVERLRRALAEAGDTPLAATADRLIAEAGRAPERPDDIALLLAARWGGSAREGGGGT